MKSPGLNPERELLELQVLTSIICSVEVLATVVFETHVYSSRWVHRQRENNFYCFYMIHYCCYPLLTEKAWPSSWFLNLAQLNLYLKGSALHVQHVNPAQCNLGLCYVSVLVFLFSLRKTSCKLRKVFWKYPRGVWWLTNKQTLGSHASKPVMCMPSPAQTDIASSLHQSVHLFLL